MQVQSLKNPVIHVLHSSPSVGGSLRHLSTAVLSIPSFPSIHSKFANPAKKGA